ncbi:hypothetical protein SAMN05518672_1073 [Chitinophaga sp. CF118]|uniref:hypothetical protein n=1 Tax=Chitinophaga sp. CF118 TaxID=1884367 RepID=UPI0008DF4EA9|nr:hypothetical protein [Chitinophaga sp. CF118]SFE49619.1 hypothetical protein SAMN05518672_1073 [Chitinophaga sp. CF118]
MNEHIPQIATLRIECNKGKGTALLFFPGSELEYVYVLTAKHCLMGEHFDQPFTYSDILLDKIFNPKAGTYHSCRLTDTDVIVFSGDTEDLALIILPKERIVTLTETEFPCQVIDTAPSITDYQVRGFASFNDQEADRSFELTYREDQKDNKNLFLLWTDASLDTYYDRALTNVKGLSGGGVFAKVNGNTYLTGIMHLYENGNIFTATKVLAYNALIDRAKYRLIDVVKPETDASVLDAFRKMDLNREEINRRTNDKVGLVHVPRDISKLESSLFSSGMAVVHGKPGVGKSALAKSTVSSLKGKGGITVITFTPEQLYCNSLAEALVKAGYHADIERLLSSPLSGSRVVFWIESFEKLIESGYGDAFRELLGYLRKNSNLSLLLTIRDYTLQKFKINFRFELPEGDIYYALDAFNDAEIDKIRELIPEMGPLLDNPKLDELLRTPYYLDKAVRILPELLKNPGVDEGGFKKLMWEHIVEAGNRARGQVFSRICLKRAGEMSLFTTTEEASDVVEALVRDNMLQEEQSETGNRYSPSHDILEDWALTRHIKEKWRNAEHAMDFISTLDESPAMVRAFRLWLDEFYRDEPQRSAAFVQGILMDDKVDQKWKDVLLVATLRSAHAAILLDTLQGWLLEDNGRNLRKIMGLLQTGCKTFDHKGKDFNRLAPVGSGWDYMITFVRKNLSAILTFKGFEFTYLDVVEAWSKRLPDFNPVVLPPASADAAFLLEDYLYRYQDKLVVDSHNRWEDVLLKRNVEILFKLTGAAQEPVKQLLGAATDIDKKCPRWKSRGFLQSICDYAVRGKLSDQLCKYFPDNVIRIAEQDWTKEEITEEPSMIGSIRIHEEPDIDDFGIEDNMDSDFDFPSGNQSFLYWMFLYHPDKALDFLLPFLNACLEKNSKIRSGISGAEIKVVTITFPDGSVGNYYGCMEYWSMYRGFNARSRLISSLLMALEKALLDLPNAEEGKATKASRLLNRMIRESNNVAVLGVVASIMQAHPELVDENSVMLLGVKDFYLWDGGRYSNELVNLHDYHDVPEFAQERRAEDKRPHRKAYYQGLVGFVTDYMFRYQTHRPQLDKLLDAMWDAANSKDMPWWKFLYDMDARKYAIQRVEEPGYENMVQLVPGYDQEVKEMMSGGSLFGDLPIANTVWSYKVFRGEHVSNKTYSIWKTGYDSLQGAGAASRIMLSPGALAAIGLRDFFDQLAPAELEWCQQELFRYAQKQLKPKSDRFGSFETDTNEAMFGLSFILKLKPAEAITEKGKSLIFRLLVSPMDGRAKHQLIDGLISELRESNPDFLTDCWCGLLEYINREEMLADKSVQKAEAGYFGGPDEDEEAQEMEWLNGLVSKVVKSEIDTPKAIQPSLRNSTYHRLNDALRIIPADTTLPQQHEFIQRLFSCHVEYLNDRKPRRRYDYFESRTEFKSFYARFLLSQPQELAAKLFNELLEATLPKKDDPDTDELDKFLDEQIKELIYAVDGGSSVENFWALWEQLRLFVLKHPHPYLLPYFLLDIKWKTNSEHWRVLDGKSLYYKYFLTNYGHNSVDLSMKLLSGVGFRNFMPDSISWLTTIINYETLVTVDMKLFDNFILKSFYSYGTQIKSNKAYLNDFILLLDLLILRGSAKAYMLKEELIQYKLIQ